MLLKNCSIYILVLERASVRLHYSRSKCLEFALQSKRRYSQQVASTNAEAHTAPSIINLSGILGSTLRQTNAKLNLNL